MANGSSSSAVEIIGCLGLIVALIAAIAAWMVVPEFRHWTGLEISNKASGNQTPKSTPSQEKTPVSNVRSSNMQSISERPRVATEEVAGNEVVATDFDVNVIGQTIVTISFKLKDKKAKSGCLYKAGKAYLADPNGKVYDLIREEENISSCRMIRRHEIYKHQLIFPKLESQPRFIYFHYEDTYESGHSSKNYFPIIIMNLNWK